MTTERGAERDYHDRFISATELAEYAYCHRAWWLRMARGERGEGETMRFDAGRATHHRFFWKLAIARALAALAVLLAVVAAALWLTHRA